MQITRLARQPIHRLRYLNAGRRGKRESSVLPILVGEANGLGEGVDAWILASDLQGVVSGWDGQSTLLGVALVDELLQLAEHGVLPYPERTGVVLAGDLFSAPGGDVRGASGDVREVWEAFASAYRWVVGVAGNHDRFGEGRERARFESLAGVHLLDGDVVTLDGVVVGGVGEIVGDPEKPGRKSPDDFLARLSEVMRAKPDVIVLHQGPEGDDRQAGEPLVTEALATFERTVVCGHVHWEHPWCDGRRVLKRARLEAELSDVRSRGVSTDHERLARERFEHTTRCDRRRRTKPRPSRSAASRLSRRGQPPTSSRVGG